MTDHDQAILDLMRERALNHRLWNLIIALCVAVLMAAANLAVQSFQRGHDLAALTAKCGLEAP